jgi:serine/threonine-protein phosphatase 2A activator
MNQYVRPTKHILSPAHLAAFRRSPTYHDILDLVKELNQSIIGKKLKEKGDGNEVLLSID